MIMKASELRIGNLFTDGNKVKIVQSIEFESHQLCYFIFCTDGGEHFSDCIEPIPLTEEWLIKFGIIKASDNYFVMGCYYLEFHNDVLTIALKDGIIAKYNHVHQLQNLYFALTQTELKYYESK